MLFFPLKRQWLAVSLLAVVFFVGNVYLLARFSFSFGHAPQKGSQGTKKPSSLGLFIRDDNNINDFKPFSMEGSNRVYTKGNTMLLAKQQKSLATGKLGATLSSKFKRPMQSGLEQHPQKAAIQTTPGYKSKTAVLVIACNRPSVGRCLDQLLELKPENIDVPIFVSQDCGDEPTSKVIQSYGKKIKHLKHPILGDVENVPPNLSQFMGYYKISRHYKWALTQAFAVSGIDSVIVVEDDLDIAPDFFEYFLATRPLLDKDPSLFCISAWNDNGKEGYVKDNSVLYRTDFFPGLGWMLKKSVWEEFSSKWPMGFWDDWIRQPSQRKGRSCIAPEISRTKTFGRIGVSMGQFFDQYLKYIYLNKVPYPFQSKDLTYLIKPNYDKEFNKKVYSSPEVELGVVLASGIKEGSLRVTYNSNMEFDHMARQLGLMHDLKSGVPRMAYRGVVTFYRKNCLVYIAPPQEWSGYVES